MRTIICGSRFIKHYEHVVAAVVESGWADQITEVISGTCRGPDQLGERWGERNGVPVRRFPAKWWDEGKAAGIKRNVEMALYAGPEGAVIAVWDGKSRGTRHMVEYAKKLGMKVYVKEVKC